jgi:hypothetical protein
VLIQAGSKRNTGKSVGSLPCPDVQAGAPQRSIRPSSARPERHLLGVALRCSLARSAGDLWTSHDLLRCQRNCHSLIFWCGGRRLRLSSFSGRTTPVWHGSSFGRCASPSACRSGGAATGFHHASRWRGGGLAARCACAAAVLPLLRGSGCPGGTQMSEVRILVNNVPPEGFPHRSPTWRLPEVRPSDFRKHGLRQRSVRIAAHDSSGDQAGSDA